MNYELKSSARRRGTGGPIKAVLVVIVILVVLYFFAPNFLSHLLTPFARVFWPHVEKPDVSMISIEAQNAIIAGLQSENTALKETLGRSGTENVLLAYILKKPPFTAYDSYILDVGAKHGVTVGDKVYALGNILIGEILETSNSASKVRLYSSYGQKHEVLIGEQNIQATATGRGGGAYEAIVPRDVKVAEGNTITIPGISNAVFGVVNAIIADPAHTFSSVLFSPPVNIYEQKWAVVYLKNKE